MNNIIYAMIISALLMFNSPRVFAEDAPAVTSSNETRSSIAKIIYAGLGGAVIGLSTLSFYGEPQDHMGNVAIGFAAGIIGGALYVTYSSVAMNPMEEPVLLAQDRRSKNRYSYVAAQPMVSFTF